MALTFFPFRIYVLGEFYTTEYKCLILLTQNVICIIGYHKPSSVSHVNYISLHSCWRGKSYARIGMFVSYVVQDLVTTYVSLSVNCLTVSLFSDSTGYTFRTNSVRTLDYISYKY